MKILAVDTSTLTGSIALLESVDSNAPAILSEMTLSISVRHSEKLLPAISTLLSETNEELSGMDLLAVSVGPGSFTGLRIGMAAVQGLALSINKPAIGVSSLKALALNGSFFPGPIVPMIDARRGEIYGAAFEPKQLELTISETVAAPQPFLEKIASLKASEILFLGSGVATYRTLIAETLGSRAVLAPSLFQNPRAVSVGYLAWQQHLKGELLPLRPKYIRSAETTFKRLGT